MHEQLIHKRTLFLVGGIKGLQAYSTQVVTNALFRELNKMGWRCELLVFEPGWIPSSIIFRLFSEAIHRYVIYPLWCRNKIPAHALVYITDHANAGVLQWLKKPVKSIIHVHDLTSLRPPSDFPYTIRWHNRLIWLMSYFTKRKGIKSADHLIAISSFTAQEIKRYLNIDNNKITVAYDGIDYNNYYPENRATARKKLKIPENAFIVVSVGPKSLRKNYSIIAKSLTDLSLSYNKITWLHVGKITDNAKQIIAKCTQLEFTQKQGLSDLEMRLLYSSASVFISASLYEGFGLPPVEALACGAIVIASDIPAHREILADMALYFNPLNYCTLTAILKVILNNTSGNKTEITGIRDKYYNWETTANVINRVLLELDACRITSAQH
jgi:glycosyltransferase involved in cell wall biosynthesis